MDGQYIISRAPDAEIIDPRVWALVTSEPDDPEQNILVTT